MLDEYLRNAEFYGDKLQEYKEYLVKHRVTVEELRSEDREHARQLLTDIGFRYGDANRLLNAIDDGGSNDDSVRRGGGGTSYFAGRRTFGDNGGGLGVKSSNTVDDELAEYLDSIDMSHNIELLEDNGFTTMYALRHATSEDLVTIGILTGNAVFITRHLESLSPSFEVSPSSFGSGDAGFEMMGVAKDAELFKKDGTLLHKLSKFTNLKRRKHVGDFESFSVWEVKQEKTNMRFALKARTVKDDKELKLAKREIDIWKRVNERGTRNVPKLLDSKVDKKLVLILMEYTPSSPVSTAYKYLEKMWQKKRALEMMKDAAAELLVLLADVLKDLHSIKKGRNGSDQIFHLGVHKPDLLVKLDSMGNFSDAQVIDFTRAEVRTKNNPIGKHDIADDWAGLLITFMTLYRNMMKGVVKLNDSSDSLKKELRSVPHIKAVDDQITKIIRETKGGTDERVGKLMEAARSETTQFSRSPKDIIFDEDGFVIGFKPVKGDKSKASQEQILFSSAFLKNSAESKDNCEYMVSADNGRYKFPQTYRGNATDGFVGTLDDEQSQGKQWRITKTDHIYELLEEIADDPEHPERRTPVAVLRINLRKKFTSAKEGKRYRNVWLLARSGIDDADCASFATTRRVGRQLVFDFEFYPKSLETANDRLNCEKDFPAPHKQLGVGIGWRLTAVNGKTSDDGDKLVRMLQAERPPVKAVFVKPGPTPGEDYNPCGMRDEMSMKIYIGGDMEYWHIWEMGTVLKFYIWPHYDPNGPADSRPWPAKTRNEPYKTPFQVREHFRKASQRAAYAWNRANVGVRFQETDRLDDATFIIQYEKEPPVYAAAISFFPHAYMGVPETVDICPKAINSNWTFWTWRYAHKMMMHEFGHILGLRHEHAGWPIVDMIMRENAIAVKLGPTDFCSVMSYSPCLFITPFDAFWTRYLYKRFAEGYHPPGQKLKWKSAARV